MFTQDVIECTLALLQLSCALLSTLVGLAVGSKGFLRSITGPAGFLEEIRLLIEGEKEGERCF